MNLPMTVVPPGDTVVNTDCRECAESYSYCIASPRSPQASKRVIGLLGVGHNQ